jgi:hypothetical protein
VVGVVLTRIHDALAARHCRMMVWHDMFLRADDPRWKGITPTVRRGRDAAGCAAQRRGCLRLVLRRSEKRRKSGRDLSDAAVFQDKGFPVLTCPWENKEGYEAQSMAVKEIGLDGMLCTTWHHLYGSTLCPIYVRAARATWGARPSGGYENLVFAQHLRQVDWDIPVKQYKDTGFFGTQLPEKSATPR